MESKFCSQCVMFLYTLCPKTIMISAEFQEIRWYKKDLIKATLPVLNNDMRFDFIVYIFPLVIFFMKKNLFGAKTSICFNEMQEQYKTADCFK